MFASLAILASVALSFCKPGIQPPPVTLEASSTEAVRLDAETTVAVNGFADEIRAEFALWFGLTPKVVAGTDLAVSTNRESYVVTAKDARLGIAAADASGARFSVRTLFQLAVPARGTMRTTGFLIPACRIEDHPALAWRGIHFCWFPERGEKEISRAIYLAALFRFNYVVLENWGVYRSPKHPWYGWEDGVMTPEAVRRLAAQAKSLGVELVPQLNVFGHASLCRRISGKHAALDHHPEYAPLFEPDGGWNWCLTNPEVYRVQADLADELWELCGKPKYFHIGCDEAAAFNCPTCRVAGGGALFEKVVRFHADRFAQRGVKVLMWHDMFLKKGDARWKGLEHNGWDDTVVFAAKLPANVVVCDWYYGKKRESYPSLDYFRGLGLPLIACGWQDQAGTMALAGYACEHGLLGYLGTTWMSPLQDIGVAAAAAWGTPVSANASLQDNWRRCGQLAGITDYPTPGFIRFQDGQ